MHAVPTDTDVLIIGAGPSGAIASALLKKAGHDVIVMEKEQFPRFSVGESLLPHCMQYIEQAGMLEAVDEFGFQYKNGAAFRRGSEYSTFDFREKFGQGPGTTFQVERAPFDKLLADLASEQGVPIFFKHEITAVRSETDSAHLDYINAEGDTGHIRAKFILDASGFGRVLPRLLKLERPSSFPVRKAIFTHADDHISDTDYDRSKVLITVHPTEKDIWYWLIPLRDGRCSLGVIAKEEQIEARRQNSTIDHIQAFIDEAPEFRALLADAKFNYPAREITGFSSNVSTLVGERFALLGNAGEFLDPIFSSGITIAMRSASMAAALLDKQLNGKPVDWQSEYSEPLAEGVNTFRTFVEAWYDGRFQDIIFFEDKQKELRDQISAILAGYAWDKTNPCVQYPERFLKLLYKVTQA